MDPSKLITTVELCKRLGISRKMMGKLVAEGLLTPTVSMPLTGTGVYLWDPEIEVSPSTLAEIARRKASCRNDYRGSQKR